MRLADDDRRLARRPHRRAADATRCRCARTSRPLACWLGDDAAAPRRRGCCSSTGRARCRRRCARSTAARPRRPARWRPADALALNDIGRVTLRFASPLPVENYSTSRRGGAFLLIDAHDGRTLAAGMVGCRGSRRAPASDTCPSVLDLTGRRGARRGRRRRPSVAPGRGRSSTRARSCASSRRGSARSSRDLAVSGRGSTGSQRDYAGPADLDGAWFVAHRDGEPAVDREVAADAARRADLVRRRRPTRHGTTASVAARADVTTPDGRSPWPRTPPATPVWPRRSATGSSGRSPPAPLDLRRTRTGADAGRTAGSPSSAAGPAPTACSPPAATSCSRRPTSSSSTGSPRARSSTGCRPRCGSSTSARRPANHPVPQDADQRHPRRGGPARPRRRAAQGRRPLRARARRRGARRVRGTRHTASRWCPA